MSEDYNPSALEYRMYFLVPYNISPIQQGIQALHAAIEYAMENIKSPEFQKWAKSDKTVILLNGRTFNDSDVNPGTMNTALKRLLKEGVQLATFREPDLNNGLSAIAFLVDERVFNKEKYPYPVAILGANEEGASIAIKIAPRVPEEYWTHAQLQEVVGGYKNAFLRGFLQDYRLA